MDEVLVAVKEVVVEEILVAVDVAKAVVTVRGVATTILVTAVVVAMMRDPNVRSTSRRDTRLIVVGIALRRILFLTQSSLE
jgi:hypothetical protein